MSPALKQLVGIAALAALVVGFSLIWLAPRLKVGRTRIRRRLQHIAARRRAVAWAIACGAMALRVALLPMWKIPTPSVPDEFSHLLVADTVASGRLTNPSHPMWQHFETPYVLQRPTYASAYPPAQGLLLAAGKVIAGQPWWGVWFSVGVLCAAYCWMFQQWLPPLWAMMGGLWTAMQLGVGTYWMNSYWGGAVSATGGALVIGAAARLRHGVTAGRGAVFAAGLGILAASRPYEGGALGLATSVFLIWEWRRPDRRSIRTRALLPAAAILLVFGAALSYYAWRITGNPLEWPQAAYMKQYALTKAFVWQKSPPPPVFRHPILEAQMKTFVMEEGQYNSGTKAFVWTLWKALRIAAFYLGPLMLVPLALLPWLYRGRFRGLLFIAAGSAAAILLVVFLELHYAAPMSGLFYLLTVQSLRILWAGRRRGGWMGRWLVPAMPVVCLLTALQTATPPSARPAHVRRAALLEQLLQTHQEHLIIVRYSQFHRLADEWVYNDANIDQSPVVWARDMGPLNAELVDYFRGRRIWYLDADQSPLTLDPYGEQPAAIAR